MAIGKTLFFLGCAIAAIGAVFWLVEGRTRLGRLPGDFVFRAGSGTIYVPLATCILVSIVLSVILALFSRLRH